MASNSCIHGRGASTITAVHPNIIETHILTRLDGPSLASMASTSPLLHKLCNKEYLWEDLCKSTWNSIEHPLVRQTISSFSGGYRSFFSDSFPLLGPNSCQVSYKDQVHTSELISAVDIYYGNDHVHANVIATKMDKRSSLGSLFCVELLDEEETAEMPIKYEGDENKCMLDVEKNLRLSWIIIDPNLRRAGNVSSLRPVSVRPYWDGSGIKVKYATILSGMDTTEFVECRVVAMFGCEVGKNIELKELSLCVVDMYQTRLNGEKSLRILTDAMQRGKRKKANGEEKEMYVKYMDLKRKKRDELKKDNMVYRVLWLTHGFWGQPPPSLSAALW
ncbi:F-box protein At2g27310-like [Apium graveolens]|uniref:F-box protein At2g27310-like n=1 Tax=Apium graveolens TaxID=4045 RepID=UPI003D793FAB